MKEKRPIVSKNLPSRIRELRSLKGWSQGQLALKVQVDSKQISKYERGVIFPSVDMMIKLAKAFGISLDDLIFDNRKIDLSEIPNQELVKRFDKICELNEESQKALILIMDGLIKKQQLEELAQG